MSVMTPLDDDRKKREEEDEMEAWAVLFGKPSALPTDISRAVQQDIRRRLRGLPPKYGNIGAPGRLRDDESSPVPAAVTPKIYSGGDGSNHDPPAAGAATVQRVRDTAEAERRYREGLLVATAR